MRKIQVSLVNDPDAPSFYAKTILHQKMASQFAKELIGDSATESFLVMVLNNKNKIIAHEIVSMGGRNACIVDPVVVFYAIVSQMGSAFICAHNHPSGDSTPSADDNLLTRRLMMCADIFGIMFVDHIILGDGNEYSYANTNFELAKKVTATNTV